MKNDNSYEIMASVNEAFQNWEIDEARRGELINAELKFLEIGEY